MWGRKEKMKRLLNNAGRVGWGAGKVVTVSRNIYALGKAA